MSATRGRSGTSMPTTTRGSLTACGPYACSDSIEPLRRASLRRRLLPGATPRSSRTTRLGRSRSQSGPAIRGAELYNDVHVVRKKRGGLGRETGDDEGDAAGGGRDPDAYSSPRMQPLCRPPALRAVALELAPKALGAGAARQRGPSGGSSTMSLFSRRTGPSTKARRHRGSRRTWSSAHRPG